MYKTTMVTAKGDKTEKRVLYLKQNLCVVNPVCKILNKRAMTL